MKPFRVTVIGAESTGKTTLSRQLADTLQADWVCEFARPYLEVTDGRVITQSMNAIWQGQLALQYVAKQSTRHYVLHDTDLYATVGYWQLPHVEPLLGSCPTALIHDARRQRSDLYLITLANIPFEQDRLRYGGDTRESPDQYWIDLCKRFDLPFYVIQSADQADRIAEALGIITERSLVCAA